MFTDLIEWPALTMFRNGMIVTYNEDVQQATEKQLHDWLTSEDTLKIIGVIDEVSFYTNVKLYLNQNNNLGKSENAQQYNRGRR